MADCGASGSALDRAASAIVSSATGGRGAASTQAAGKAVASLIGGAAVTTTTSGGGAAMGMMMMPAAPPDRLFLPGAHSVPNAAAAAAHHPAAHAKAPGPGPVSAATVGRGRQMDHAWNAAAGPQQRMAVGHPRHGGGGVMMPPQQQQQQQAMMAQHHHQQQMQMQMAHMQQMQMQQMMVMQQQQQQQMVSQRQQQAESIQLSPSEMAQQEQKQQPAFTDEGAAAQATAGLRDAAAHAAASSWHDNLEADLRSELRSFRREAEMEEDEVITTAEDEDDDVFGHEGYTEGATIEQLAAAWAEAEAEAEHGAELDAAEEAEFGANVASAYRSGMTDAAGPDLAPYDFSEESRTYLVGDSAAAAAGAQRPGAANGVDLMAEGMRHFHAGNIPEAVLSFESELRNVDPDNSDAWRMLGRCHAENDEDRRAIACLERAVDRDPYSVEALLALGTSYVNELDHARALQNLKAWVSHNPTYAGMELPPPPSMAVEGGGEEARERSALEEVKKLLRAAMDFDPTDAADALEALGVVCNVSREYDVAVDSFREAIEARPDDYQLWNKLGATLANSNRSAEALPAYHQALQLKPRYARAWLNMAISHSNMHNYDEAARCYLQTLSLNPAAHHVWSYLRIALTCSERWDLLPLAASQNLDGFKEHFDFVQY